MKQGKRFIITTLALAAMLLAACGPMVGGPGEKAIYVGPYQVDCEGVGPQKCLLVKEDPKDDWTLFYDQIEGFDYEAGFDYQLTVREEKVENPPADASSIRWMLVEVVSQTRSLEGTTWVMDSYRNGEGVLQSALPGSEATTRFQQDKVGGNASCNNYFGVYRLDGEKLWVDVGGMTEMYCMPEELMAQERDFLAALDDAVKYRIVEDKLQIEDRSGKPVLEFSARVSVPLVGTPWQLTGFDNGTGGFSSVLAGTEITAQFGEDGKLVGNSGCNNYATGYEISGNRISTGPVASTMMMCPEQGVMEQERAYLGALEAATEFQIEGKTLTMVNAEGQRVLAFTVREPASLTGITWQAMGYNNGKQAVVSIVIGTEITAIFGEDGTLTGSAGCNTYNASYQVDGDSISIGQAATTRKFCGEPEGTMDQESAYLAALQMAQVYRIDGDRLQLRTAEGSLVADYQIRMEVEGAGFSDDMLKNMEYKSEWTQSGVAPLANGEYREPVAPDSAAETVAMLVEPIARGELNGQPAAAVILVSDPGGSGTFYDLAVVVEQGGQPVNIATTFLGDRVRINSLTIENNQIVVDMVASGPDDPMCCPTQQVVQTYALEGDQLVQTSNEVVGSSAEGRGLGEEALKNMEYQSEWTQSGVAPLTDGEYREPAAPGSATETIVKLTEHVAYGNLNGRSAAAVILVTDPGGSGTFYDLAVVVEQDGQPVNIATVSLGDRAQINSLAIENNQIVVDMITHGPDDPMCCPTQRVVLTFAFEGDQLMQTSKKVFE